MAVHRLKKRVLFVGEGVTLAHVVRPFQLAQSLDPAVFETHLACSPAFTPMLAAESVKLHHIASRTPEQFLAILERGDQLFPKTTLLEYVESDRELIRRIQPDAVVGDLRLSLAVSAPLEGIPYVALTNAYWSPYRIRRGLPLPSFSFIKRLGLHRFRGKIAASLIERIFGLFLPLILNKQGEGLNDLRKLHGLPAFEDYFLGFTWGDFTCFADTPSVAPVTKLPEYHSYLGPIFWSPQSSLPRWWGELDKTKPLIILSLGSSGAVELLPVLFEALAGINAEVVVVTAGRVGLERVPTGFRSVDYLPLDEVGSQAALVITNGGSPSSYQVLRHGTPVLGLPLNMDQLLCMEGVAAAGAGIMLRADNCTGAEIRSAINRLLKDNEVKQAALGVAEEFSRYDYRHRFPLLISEILGMTGSDRELLASSRNRHIA